MGPEDAGRVRLSSAEPSIRLQGSATDRTPTDPCVFYCMIRSFAAHILDLLVTRISTRYSCMNKILVLEQAFF
jgi:hypothetical protein